MRRIPAANNPVMKTLMTMRKDCSEFMGAHNAF